MTFANGVFNQPAKDNALTIERVVGRSITAATFF